MADLADKVALITGATSGIGLDTAVLFAEHGAKIVLAGRREKEGADVLALVRKAGSDGIFMKTDVAKAADVERLVKTAADKFGRIDIAFNNAGIEGNWKPITDLSEHEWDDVIDVNLKGVFLCLKYEIQQMLKQSSGGAIVNMSSVAGLMGTPAAAPYGASKHGVISLTRTAALEYAKQKIRVNAVCPAVIGTPMGDRLFGAPEIQPMMVAMHPIGRWGTPREVSEAVLFMCSERSSFMTGHYIVTDGGFLVGPQAVPGT
jgi:NAD(P)-dependent dehydrogenase (short-subunit alcohol dehydrogenase family)